MDLSIGTDIVKKWAALSYELGAACADWSLEVGRRVDEELATMHLTGRAWEGEAPFTIFANPRLPGPSSYPGDILVERVLFKVERWSAPDIGGVVRGYLSGDQEGWTTRPELVLDFADVGGVPRLVAMHRPCPRCKTTAVGKTGGVCDYETRSGIPCLDGLLFEGGLSFDRGQLEGGERFAEPAAKWAPLMER